MKIFPAIDIKEGKSTRLIGGKFGTERFMLDPLEVLKKFQISGIERIHIIDLDATKGTGNNIEVIKKLIENTKVETEVGGGIRSIEKAKEIISFGADRIIVGTRAIQDFNFVLELEKEIGKDKIIISLDSRNRKIAIKGWDEITDLDPIETAKKLQEHCNAFLLTCIEKEGKMEGLDFEYFKRFTKEIKTPLIASGGVGSLEDIKKLKELGVYAVVIGTAIYLGNFKLEDAIAIGK